MEDEIKNPIGKVTIDFKQKQIYAFRTDATLVTVDPNSFPPCNYLTFEEMSGAATLAEAIRGSLKQKLGDRI